MQKIKQKPKSKSKIIDIIVLILLVFAGYGYNLIMHDSYFGRAVFGMGAMVIPSIIYLCIRRPKPWLRLIVGSIVFGALYGLFLEFIQEFNHAYNVISVIFPKLFGVVPIDNIIGHSMMALLMFTFYEHFIPHNRTKKISIRVFYAVALGLVAITTTVLLYYFSPTSIKFDYSYSILGLIAITPLIILIFRRPSQVLSLVKIMPFFFFLYYMIEVVAVRYNWWIYPAYHFIGYVSIQGTSFPFEEMLFWMFFYAPTLIAYYKIAIEPKRQSVHIF